MSEKKEETAQPTSEKAREQVLEEAVAQLLKAQEETKKTIDTLAKAIVEVNKKVETKNPKAGETDALTAVLRMVTPKGGTIEEFAKQAESFVRVAESLDRFRNPSRLGLGEAMLMRLGMRSAFPRYMTKAELQKAEKQLGVWEVLEEAEGEHPE